VGLGIEEFLIREYSFALWLTANCDYGLLDKT